MGSGSMLKRELADLLTAFTEADQRNLDFLLRPVDCVSIQSERWQRELSVHVFVYITCMGSRMDMHAYLLWGQ